MTDKELYEEYQRYQNDWKKKKGRESEMKKKEIEIDDMIEDFEGEEHENENEEMESFNMDEERESGMIDREGNLISRREKEDDAWMKMMPREVSRDDEKRYKEMKAIHQTKAAQEEEKYEKMKKRKSEYYLKHRMMLNENETPQRGIIRMKKEKRMKEMNDMMELCNCLVSLGDYEVYTRKKESFSL